MTGRTVSVPPPASRAVRRLTAAVTRRTAKPAPGRPGTLLRKASPPIAPGVGAPSGSRSAFVPFSRRAGRQRAPGSAIVPTDSRHGRPPAVPDAKTPATVPGAGLAGTGPATGRPAGVNRAARRGPGGRPAGLQGEDGRRGGHGGPGPGGRAAPRAPRRAAPDNRLHRGGRGRQRRQVVVQPVAEGPFVDGVH